MISNKKQRLIDYNEMIGKETNHIRNKDESKLLRKIMAESGLTEVEIIKIPKYREMLSKVQKEGQKSKLTEYDRAVKKITKTITKELKLAKEHPLVVKKVKEKIESLKKQYYFWYWRF